jgi:hypothetical protein
VQTLGDIPMCLTGFDAADLTGCPTWDECNPKRSCPGGKVCSKVEGCCGTPRRRCLKRCPAKS